jgi:hypothetical protein
LEAELASDNDQLRSQGIIINATRIEYHTNSVYVTLDPTSLPGSELLLTTTYGSTGLFFTDRKGAGTGLSDPRYNPPTGSPVYAGQDITDGSYTCTANISAVNQPPLLVKYWAVTAGHCFHNGTSVSQNAGASYNRVAYSSANKIGAFSGFPSAGSSINCDCGLIGPLSSSQISQAALVNSNSLYTFNNIGAASADFSGRPSVCESGAAEYATYGHIICGTLDAYTGVSYAITELGVTYTTTDLLYVTYPTSQPPVVGDSGGPTGNGPSLVGLMYALNSDGYHGYSSKALHLADRFPSQAWIIPND